LTKAVTLDTKSALAYRNRGLAYHDLGQLNQAIEDYNVAIRLEPTAFESYFERGNAFLDLGQNQKAIADYDQALALDAGRATAWLNRGQAYRRLGKLALAQADFVKARQLDPSIKPDEVAQAPSQAVAPTQPVATPVSQQTDFAQLEIARRERALQVATDFLKGKGLHVRAAPAGAPFALLCESANGKYRVDVKVSVDEKTTLRLTREEIDALGHSNVPTALVIVGKLTPPATVGQPCAGGSVMRFIENWKPAPEKLVPVVFEYPLG
jgi:tetratricopeptide (TPR) repeat protein